MKIEINVDETQFKDLIEENIKDLPKEKIHEILLEGIKNYITPKFIEDMFVEHQQWYGRYYPSSYLKEVIKTNLPEDAFKGLAEEVIQQLKDNYDEILRKAIVDLLINGITNTCGFENAIRETFYHIEQERANR